MLQDRADFAVINGAIPMVPTDKISGTNNNGQYNINWDDFLPRGYNFFKMTFNFQTSGGYYKDFTGNVFAAGKIVFNTGGKSHSFDTKTMSQSNTIKYIQRDIQTTAFSHSIVQKQYQDLIKI